MRPVPTKAKHHSKQAFTKTAHAYLKTQRAEFLAGLTGPQAVKVLEYARAWWLLPTESLDDLTPGDMFGIHPELYAERIRMGLMEERTAKFEIAGKVRETIEALKAL